MTSLTLFLWQSWLNNVEDHSNKSLSHLQRNCLKLWTWEQEWRQGGKPLLFPLKLTFHRHCHNNMNSSIYESVNIETVCIKQPGEWADKVLRGQFGQFEPTSFWRRPLRWPAKQLLWLLNPSESIRIHLHNMTSTFTTNKPMSELMILKQLGSIWESKQRMTNNITCPL